MAPPRTGAVRTCLECGKEMYLSPKELPRRKYCSRACQSQAVDRSRRTTCVRCGKSFGQAPSVGGKYCSRSCYLADRQKRETCAVCAKPLEPHELTYCSQECMAVGRRTLEQKPCEVCGTPMAVQPYQFNTKRVCSRACNNELKRRTKRSGPGHKYTRKDGYIAVHYPDHPDAGTNGYVLEHRLVAEEKYGRRIARNEHVHHINGKRDDNRPDNIEVVNPGLHAGITNKAAKENRRRMRDELAAYRQRFGPLPDP